MDISFSTLFLGPEIFDKMKEEQVRITKPIPQKTLYRNLSKITIEENDNAWKERGYSLYDESNCKINQIWINEYCRNQGFGTQLFNKTLENMSMCQKVTWETRKENIHLCEKLGAVVKEKKENFPLTVMEINNKNFKPSLTSLLLILASNYRKQIVPSEF